jgi:hypothetical protein
MLHLTTLSHSALLLLHGGAKTSRVDRGPAEEGFTLDRHDEMPSQQEAEHCAECRRGLEAG